MDKKAAGKLLGVVLGLCMMLTGMALFLSKVKISSDFLNTDGGWSLWRTSLMLVPLAAGILMLIIKPKFRLSKWIAAIGALLVIVMIVANVRIVIHKNTEPFEWVIYGVLIVAGFLVNFISLFGKRKKQL